MAFHFYDSPDSAVFDGTSPNGTFTDLDLSSYLDEQCVAVLRVYGNADGTTANYLFRPNGSSHTITGCPATRVGYQKSALVGCLTDSGRIVEWTSSLFGAAATKVYLFGWFDATAVDHDANGTPALSNQSISSSTWTECDLSGSLSADQLALIQLTRDSGDNHVVLRPSDETTDVNSEYRDNDLDVDIRQPCGGYMSASNSMAALVPAGGDGKLDANATSGSGDVQADFYVQATVDDFERLDEYHGAISGQVGTWQDIDLSTELGGAKNGMVLLKITRTTLATTNYCFAGRPNDSTWDLNHSATTGSAGLSDTGIGAFNDAS